jgi:hypothetical protein
MWVWDLMPASDQTKAVALWSTFLRNGEQRTTVGIRSKDGGIIAVDYFATAHVLPSLHLSALMVRAPRLRPKVIRDAELVSLYGGATYALDPRIVAQGATATTCPSRIGGTRRRSIVGFTCAETYGQWLS